MPSMRVLVLHNAYDHRGGEDEVVARESELLASAGHDTHCVVVSNSRLKNPFRAILAGISLPYSRPARRRLTRLLAETAPDIVHLHNYFPLLTPSVLDSCIDARIPIVHTLHNYRFFCANGLLLRRGSPCQLCLHGSPFNAARFKCYRESRAASLAVARMVAKHRRLQTWQSKVDRFIAPSVYCKELLASAGLPRDRIVVKPHFTLQSESVAARKRQEYALYVGRLSVEKGISMLLDAWREVPHELHIVGDGPLRHVVQSSASENNSIKYLGPMDRGGVDTELQGAGYLVFPSLLPETFGMTIIEAYAQGTPVLVSRLGSQAQLVEDYVTGLQFEAGNSSELAKKAIWMSARVAERQEMGVQARSQYEQKYTAKKNLELLLTIYNDARKKAFDRGNRGRIPS